MSRDVLCPECQEWVDKSDLDDGNICYLCQETREEAGLDSEPPDEDIIRDERTDI